MALNRLAKTPCSQVLETAAHAEGCRFDSSDHTGSFLPSSELTVSMFGELFLLI